MPEALEEKNILYFMTIPIPVHIKNLIASGDFEKASKEIDSLLSKASKPERIRFLFEKDRIMRFEREFPLSPEESFTLASQEIESLSQSEFQRLIERGCVDHITHKNGIRVFRRFIPNMFWLCPELKTRKIRGESELGAIEKEALYWRASRIQEASRDSTSPYLLPLKYTIRFTLRILEREKYPGKLRVWIPIPREDGINRAFKVLESKPPFKHIAPPEHPQRTIYFELTEEDAISLLYEFVSYGYHAKVDPDSARVTEESEILEEYTAEKPPHIVFSDYLVGLTRKIVGEEKNPLKIAQRIWLWVTSNVRYTYAMDYALYDNISEYVAKNLRGDCGMQAILFITMARIAGIPARWQSGWYLNPVRPGMHDWAQIHVEPYGWLYVDPSFGNKAKGDDWRNTFYFGSIEGYRLAANIDISRQFDPPKVFFRSDPVDNQQGEVESDEGNLYYGNWESKLEVIEVEKLKKN
ncbi:MAG: transglutaminase domain-containing protein [Infirmifilum sp.]